MTKVKKNGEIPSTEETAVATTENLEERFLPTTNEEFSNWLDIPDNQLHNVTNSYMEFSAGDYLPQVIFRGFTYIQFNEDEEPTEVCIFATPDGEFCSGAKVLISSVKNAIGQGNQLPMQGRIKCLDEVKSSKGKYINMQVLIMPNFTKNL